MNSYQRRQFGFVCVIVGLVAGFMATFGPMIDTQHPPRHIWFALPWGAITALAVCAACYAWGRLLLLGPPKAPMPPRRHHQLLKYTDPEQHNR